MNERFTCSKINQTVTKAICEMRVEKGFCNPDECSSGKEEGEMSNYLLPEKRSKVEELISKGKGNRLIERETGVSKNTVKKIRQDIITETGNEPLCKCGQPATHKGWCSERFKKSPKRQATMKKLQNKNKLEKELSNKKTPFQETVEAIELSTRLDEIKKIVDSILNTDIKELKMKMEDLEIQIENKSTGIPVDHKNQSFEELLLSKFPAFNPGWSENKTKIDWFDGFIKLLDIIRPPINKNLPKFNLELEEFDKDDIAAVLTKDNIYISITGNKDELEALQSVRKFIEQFPIDIDNADLKKE